MRAAFHALCYMLWCTALHLYHITYLHIQTKLSQSVNCYANISYVSMNNSMSSKFVMFA